MADDSKGIWLARVRIGCRYVTPWLIGILVRAAAANKLGGGKQNFDNSVYKIEPTVKKIFVKPVL